MKDWPQGQLLIDDQVDKKIYIESNGKVVETLTGNDFCFDHCKMNRNATLAF